MRFIDVVGLAAGISSGWPQPYDAMERTMPQSLAVMPGYRRPAGRPMPARIAQVALRGAFIGVWLLLPLLPLTAILLTWLNGL